jgi:hypothetical protein
MPSVSGSALRTSTFVAGLAAIIGSMALRLSSPPKCRSTRHTSGCCRPTSATVAGTVWATVTV